jgi:endonuclease-8
MPEGDTVWLSAQRLHQALAGQLVTAFDLRVPKLATADLRGDTVLDVLARGKHLLMRFASGITLHSHLRMDGSWLINATGHRPTGCPGHQIRAIIGNESWQAVGCRVHDLALIETARETEIVGHLGPDLLGVDYGPSALAEAVRRLRAQPDVQIGDALLEQRNLAGIGNLYKSEVLFICRLNPFTPVAAIQPASRLEQIVSTARRQLFANRNHPEQSTTGRLAPGQQHWVYGRSGQPCRVCATPIRRSEQGVAGRERSTYWCPACQPADETQVGQ